MEDRDNKTKHEKLIRGISFATWMIMLLYAVIWAVSYFGRILGS